MSRAAVEVDNISFSYGDHMVLDSLSFTVAKGELFSILGPNGAGKTTTVEILEGFRKPASGRASIDGNAPGSHSARLICGLMLQEGGVYPGIKVGEALRLFAAYYPSPIPPGELAEMLGIGSIMRMKVRALSGGQRQRVNLALALVGSPRILFLDEPTAGMDPIVRADTWDLLQRMRDRGVTMIVTTHGLQEAEYLSDRIAILSKGVIKVCGTITELLQDQSVRFKPSRPVDVLRLSRDTGMEITMDPSGELRTIGAADPSTIARLAQALGEQEATLTNVNTGRSLEDLYRSVADTT